MSKLKKNPPLPSKRGSRAKLGALAAACAALVLLVGGRGPAAGTRETTTADRLALLYTPQFTFTREGEPLVHVGVAHGAESAEFSSDTDFRVLPLGEGGPALALPGRKRFTVSLKGGKAGSYKRWAVVERVPYGQKEALDEAVDRWVGRGYLPTTLEVGSLFALGGRRFDSREVMISVGGMSERGAALALAERLEARHGVEIELHDQLVEYPTGELTLSGGGLGAELTHKDVLWAWPSDWSQTFTVKVGGVERAYAGGIIFTVDPEGRLQVINAVPAEKLVKGVVASEVYTSAPMESLKAQSVAARGEVLSYVGARHLGEPYRLCDEVHCQAYKGVGAEHPRTNEAVEATRGEVMVEASSLGEEWRIVDARYSASSGGYSENNENVWRDAPKSYLRGRPDAVGALPAQFEGGITEQNIAAWLASDHPAWSNTQDFGGGNTWRWEKTVEAGVVQAWLDKHFQIGRLREAQVLARGVSGRVIELRFVGDRGEAVLERELAVRRAFGGLRSSMFTMKIDRDAKGYPARFHFRGGGFGHGVGMCQTGAMIMGRTKRYDDILSFYYQGVSLRRVY